jgi:Domain of unknown function (DUF4234)
MANNPAHDTPGPGSDPVEAALPAAAHAKHDVEVVGRTATAQAQLGESTATPVLVGATSATSANGHAAPGLMAPNEADPKPEPPPASDAADELPVWSFRDGAARNEVAPPGAPVDRNQVELPFAPAVEPEAPPELAARPHPLFGPIGHPRSAVAVALLAVVTLGIYALIWHHRVNRELEEFDPKLHARPARSTVAVAVPWLIGLLVTVAGAVLVVGARLSIHVPLASHVTSMQADYMLAGLATVPYLILLVPFGLVAVVMTLERLRCVEEHVGTTTDRQVRAVGTTMLLIIPVVGGLVLLGVAQRRLNAIWDAVAPAGRLFH